MAKQFLTERDIEELARRGEMTLTVSDSMVLTDLAFEKAEKLGVKLVQPNEQPPAAPVRPYLAAENPVVMSKPKPCCQEPVVRADDELKQRIRDAVKAKLGNQIDPALLETIITRVLNNVGVK
ncbi:MAG: hypothetical protein ABFD24_10225 [Anaerolineaceae bacterium]